MLKVSISNRLKSRKHFSSAMVTLKGENKPYVSIRATILNGINHMLQSIESESPARGLHIDFSSKGKGAVYNGLFKSEGLIGLLEAKDYRNVDMVSPFISMYVDRCCGETSLAPNTRVAVQYVDIIHLCLRLGLQPQW